MSQRLVIVVLVVEAAAVAATYMLTVAVAGARLLRARRWRGPLIAARAALHRALAEGSDGSKLAAGSDPALGALSRLPVEVRIGLFAEMDSVEGARRVRLASVAQRLGVSAQAEKACRSRRAWRRLRAVRLLTIVGGGRASVPALLHDRDVEVRAAAAAWSPEVPDPEVIRGVVSLLADERPLPRFTAKDALLRIGRPAVAPLVEFLSDCSERAADEAMEVAAGLAEARFLPAALRLCRSPSPRSRALAATVAGAVGGQEAVAAVVRLLDDPEPPVRAAAIKALGRLGHWPAGGQIAAGLGDSAWIVRREAGLALRALGAPGVLLLRRALHDDDRFARDMAKQVLDLPDAVRHPLSA